MDIKLDKNIKLDRAEWMRLMGVRDEHLKASETDEKISRAISTLRQQMDEGQGLLLEAAKPCFAYDVLDLNEIEIKGESLSRHLEGCSRIVIVGSTLGEGVDELIEKTQAERIALGVVIDSGASVMAVLAADLALEQIRRELADFAPEGKPVFMTSRFSPGYGDSPLQMQEQILDILDAEETLGITLSKGFMMSPSKSITGIIGLADHPVKGRLATCAECVLRDKCQLRYSSERCSSS